MTHCKREWEVGTPLLEVSFYTLAVVCWLEPCQLDVGNANGCAEATLSNAAAGNDTAQVSYSLAERAVIV